VLADPRMICYLTYKLFPDTGRVTVERAKGTIEFDLTA
jgi:hypothetical protein